MPRVTIRDIARRAGVSKGAVSYALNGQPGVSEATRARVLQVAADLNWVPNRAARSLSGARSHTFGLILARTPATLAHEPYFMEFIGGVESVLAGRSYGLLLQLVPDVAAELASYRTWSSEHRVDGVIVVDVRIDDPRIPLLEELGLPAVVVADRSLAGRLAHVGGDDAGAVRDAVAHLAGLGHRALGRVAGLAELGHVRLRDQAFADAARQSGTRLDIVHTDFSGDGGAAATRTLLDRPDRPTAIVYDNDLMAVAGLSAITELGLRVPADVSLLAWDDSMLCRITHPPLTAMGYDVLGYGAAVAQRLFGLLTGDDARTERRGGRELRLRGSTGPAPADRPGSAADGWSP